VRSGPEAPGAHAAGESSLRALLAAVRAISSELSLDALLQRLVEAAAELTGARYAALGVIDPGGRRLERFVTHGVDAETRAAIGEPPHGSGVLGALIGDARPLRLRDLHEDPRSAGFPAGHPPMRSFLGVPILLRGTAYGNLYLTEKRDGEDFTLADEELLTLLAGQAAIAIENARLYEAAARWSQRLESLNEIAAALTTETELGRLLDLLATRLRELLDARIVAVLLPDGEEALRFAAAAGDGAAELTGRTTPRRGSKSGLVLERRRSERVDSVLDDPEVDQDVTRRLAARSGIWVPLVAHDRAIGVLVAHDRLGAPDARFSDDDLRLAEAFASRAAIAVDLSERVARDALRRAVATQELERRRLARELHDETGQALTSILLGLKGLEDRLEAGGPQPALAGIRELVVATLEDVRRLSVELRPKALDDFGLEPAIERLCQTIAEQTGIEIDCVAALGRTRLPDEVETAIYRIAQESLTNAVKHAHARRVSILLTRKDGGVCAVIEDDGRGFDPAVAGGGLGLDLMRERVELLHGRLTIESSEGAGTTLVVEVPVP
jgi:two-component system, NarL family, sensor histidine kinase DevS